MRENFMRFTIATSLFAATLLLSACSSETSADSDGDGKITQAEVSAKIEKEMESVAIEPGKWENTVEFTEIDFDESKVPAEAKGMMDAMMKGMVGQKVSTSQCITEAEAKKPDANFFTGEDSKDCAYNDFTMDGGAMMMKMTCKASNGESAVMTAKGDYSSTEYSMTMDMLNKAGEMGDVRIRASVLGKRVGDCE